MLELQDPSCDDSLHDLQGMVASLVSHPDDASPVSHFPQAFNGQHGRAYLFDGV